MDQMEQKLNAILSDPSMMQQIMSIANNLGQSSPEPTTSAPTESQIDLSQLQKLASMGNLGNIDQEQKALLCALEPYLSRDRVGKLEKAMRAAKVARLASSFLGQGGLSILAGR